MVQQNKWKLYLHRTIPVDMHSNQNNKNSSGSQIRHETAIQVKIAKIKCERMG